MEALARHSVFLGSSSLSLAQRLRSTPAHRIFIELLFLVGFFAFTVKTETWLSQYIVGPLLKRLFGDNEGLRRELEENERQLQRIMDEAKAGPPQQSDQSRQPRIHDAPVEDR